jgi:hypothetical protein
VSAKTLVQGSVAGYVATAVFRIASLGVPIRGRLRGFTVSPMDLFPATVELKAGHGFSRCIVGVRDAAIIILTMLDKDIVRTRASCS